MDEKIKQLLDSISSSLSWISFFCFIIMLSTCAQCGDTSHIKKSLHNIEHYIQKSYTTKK